MSIMRVKHVTSFSAEATEEVGTNYWDPVVRKRFQGPTVFHMFLSFSVVTFFVDLKFKPFRPSASHSATES